MLAVKASSFITSKEIEDINVNIEVMSCEITINSNLKYAICCCYSTRFAVANILICGDFKGPVTRCNFSCNLQRYSTPGRCKIGIYTFPSQFANIFLTYQTFVTNLHLLRVELRCKLPGKLHRVTGS